MPGDERIIEAWAHKGKKVAATSKRLIIRSAKGGKDVTTILYDDIARIERHAEAPWAVLAVGALATAFLVAQKLMGLGLLDPLIPAPVLRALCPSGFQGVTGALTALLPLVPAAIAVAAFLPAVKRGYIVHYGSSRKLFLPESFGKALRLADKFTPKELFGADGKRRADGI